ncbi:MAG: PKD domain-containing protein, partial [Candidatus Promineifilaceae bacterium]
PVVAVLTSGSYWGYTSFIPSTEAGPVGRDFVFYHEQADSFLYIFAVEAADVELRDSGENVVDSRSLAAGDYWKLNPDSGVYHVMASGRVALELVAENAYTTVPDVSGQGVGRRFYFATDSWGTGAVAAFAYEDAEIELYDLNDDALLHSATLSAGEFWWQVDLDNRQLRLESSGDVEVWAGNTEGGEDIEDLGDDISFAGGRLGREYTLHSLMEGFVIFAPFDNTELLVEGISYSLGKDGYLHFPECCVTRHVAANQPVLVQTLGRDGSWNDFGTYLGGVVAHSGVPAPWLTADPASGTIPTDSTTPVTITFDARPSVGGGIQPGAHTADLILVSNDPVLPFVEIPLEMLVEPTANMGKVTGSVTDAWTGEALAATVTLDGVFTTAPTTTFGIWAVEGTYSLSAAAGGYAGQTFTVEITAGAETVQDVALEPDVARLELQPQSLDLAAVEGSTTTAELTIINSGPSPLEVSFHELPMLDETNRAALAGLEKRKILYDRAHNEPRLSDYSTIAADLAAAGAAVDENFTFPIDGGVLAGYDVLWVNCCGSINWTYDELAALKAWLDDGGSILIHGGEDTVTAGLADIYGIAYHSDCSYGTTTDITAHPITIGVGQVWIDTCSYLTFSSGSVPVVMDNGGQPHVVVHEEKRGKMVVVAGSDFLDWRVEEDDNRLLAKNIFAWLAEPGYEDIAWLRSLVDGAEIAGHSSQTISIEAGTKSLPKGAYEAVLAVEHNDPNRATPAKVPVTLTVGSAAPTADFSAAPTSGPSPLVVNFSNLSTGDYDTCVWDFGDGTQSTICAGPSHKYSQPGTFAVSLKVIGPGGKDKKIRVEYITIHSRPLADFKASPTSGAPPLKVKFTNLSTGDFDDCLWDFGDGRTEEGCGDPLHRYKNPGIYSVSLKVSGPGGQGKLTRVDYITVHGSPVADFSASPTSGIPPLRVRFTNLTDGEYNECLWDFGDGQTEDGCSGPWHTYREPGAYTVMLKVKGPGGIDRKIRKGLIVVYGSQTADFGASPTSGILPLKVEFNNLSMGDYDECLWDFGDGDTSVACDDPSHTYYTPGTFAVSLTVKGPGSEGTMTRADYISVYAPAAAAFSATPTSGAPPLIVDFTNLSTGDYDECLWDFGDGGREANCGDPTHEYESEGDYTITLTVSGPGGEDTMIDEGCIQVASYHIFLPRIFGGS